MAGAGEHLIWQGDVVGGKVYTRLSNLTYRRNLRWISFRKQMSRFPRLMLERMSRIVAIDLNLDMDFERSLWAMLWHNFAAVLWLYK